MEVHNKRESIDKSRGPLRGGQLSTPDSRDAGVMVGQGHSRPMTREEN